MAKYRITYQDAADYNKSTQIWLVDGPDGSTHGPSDSRTVLTDEIAIAVRDLIDGMADPIGPSAINKYPRIDITPTP